jgi:RecA/RadA recombinase
MVIELFGPPGSGKTTFARALTAHLRERGHVAELRLSYRPAERLPLPDPSSGIASFQRNAVIRRLMRPVIEMLTIARHPFANSRDVRTAVNLIRALPPRNIISAFKESQYILRLSHSWHQASSAANIELFDQAFVQVVCSLAVLAGGADDTLIAHALECAPKSDLLVRLEAPSEILTARLSDRRRLQSTVEQLFEPDLKTSLASVPIIDSLHKLLLKQGRSVLCASSLDQRSLREGVERIEQQFMANLRTEHTGWHDQDNPLLRHCR